MAKKTPKPSGHWDTKENVAEAARKYNTRTDFEKNCGGAVNAARRHGWMDEVCSHMRVIGSKVSRAIYALIFPDKQVYVGLSYDPENRINEHLKESSNIHVRDAITQHGLPEPVIFEGWFSKEEAGTAEQDKLDHFISRGYTTLNIVKAGGLGGKNGKWTIGLASEEAKKYTTRTKFQQGTKGAYLFARKNKILDDICAHMVSPQKPKGYWTKTNVAKEAKKYDTKVKFSKCGKTAYNIAVRNGYLEEVCAHMTMVQKPNGYWTIERIAVEAINYTSRVSFENGSSGAYDAALNKKCMDEVCAHME